MVALLFIYCYILSLYNHAFTISLKQNFLIDKDSKTNTDHIMVPISTISHYHTADLFWLLRKDRRRVLVCYVHICMTLKTTVVLL